jgi:hypothetical protein
MTVVSITTAKNAKPDGEADFTRTEDRFVIFRKIVSVIKSSWPKKTAAHVSFLTGVSERAVQFWLAGETRMTLEHVAALMKTEQGYQILAAIMGDCKQEWWLDTMTAAELRASRKALRVEQRRSIRLKEMRAQREMYED